MVLFNEVGVLLILLAGLGLSQQSSCPTQQYGNCDPGPDCKNWDNNKFTWTNWDACFNCCNDGYITWDKVNDGIEDCSRGTDEDEGYSWNALFQSGGLTCLRPKSDCFVNFECCSGHCMDGSCWDERCS